MKHRSGRIARSRHGLMALVALVALLGLLAVTDLGAVAAQNRAMDRCVGAPAAQSGSQVTVEWHVLRYTCVYRIQATGRTLRYSHAWWH